MQVCPALIMLSAVLQRGFQHLDKNLLSWMTLPKKAFDLDVRVHYYFQCRPHIGRKIKLLTGACGCQAGVTFSNIVWDSSLTYTRDIFL